MTPHRQRFAEVVRSEPVDLGLACLLIGAEVDRDLDIDLQLGLLDQLVSVSRPQVPPYGVADQAEGIRRMLLPFHGRPADYGDLRSSLLHEVLRRRRGLPLLLSVVWLEAAARVDVRAWACSLPGHVVVGIGDPEDEHVIVDPYAFGRVLSPAEIAERGGLSGPLSPVDLLLRLLNNIRALAASRPPSLEVSAMRLWATELSLLLPRHPLDLRRERGELLVRLGRHVEGADELELFALAVEDVDEQVAAASRREARLARAQLN